MDHKQKKKQILARNKRNQRIFQHARIHEAEHDRIVEEDKERREKQDARDEDRGEEEKIWSEKTQQIRNRLTNKKRDAHDRWNRFAGTSGGGGRGL